MIRYGKTEPLLANCISKLLKQMSFSKLITIAIGFTSLSEFFTAAWPWQRERLDTFEGQFHWWIFNETFFALFPPLLCFIIKTTFAVTCSVIRWWNKKLPNFPPKIAQKMIVTLLEIAQKVTEIIGLLLWDNFLPNIVTLGIEPVVNIIKRSTIVNYYASFSMIGNLLRVRL